MRRCFAVSLLVLPLLPLACSTSNGELPAPTPTTAPPSGTTPPPAVDDAGSADVDAPAPKTAALTVLSLNLHCLKLEGTSFTSNAARFAAIGKTIAAEHVDVVLAQEVCKSVTEDAATLLQHAAEHATGASFTVNTAFAHRAWEGTPDEADESVAIVARSAQSKIAVTVHRAQGALRRLTLGTTLDDLRVRVYTVHFDDGDAALRSLQAREAASAATSETDPGGPSEVTLPVLVGGDFNAHFDAPGPSAMRNFGFVEASGSSGTDRIDHVFLHRSAPFAATSAKAIFTGNEAVSDHPGVLVRFDLAKSVPVRLTRIRAEGTFTEPLAVRGDHPPFSWTQGWPIVGPALVTSELPVGSFQYKFLKNDAVWATGANAAGQGQADNSSAPLFP